jgi:hypothetical protein
MAKNMSITIGVSVTAAAVNADGTWDLTPCYALQEIDPVVGGVVGADGGIDLDSLWNGADPKDYKADTDIVWNLTTSSVAVGNDSMSLAFVNPSTNAIVLTPDSSDIVKAKTNSTTQVKITDKDTAGANYTYALILSCTLDGETKLVTLDPPLVNRRE